MADGASLGTLTKLAHDSLSDRPHGSVTPPIYQNSTFTFESAAELLHAMHHDPANEPYHYSRVSNPTVRVAEKKIAELEGTEDARLVGCGMAAITNAVLSVVEAGSHCVFPHTSYPPVKHLVEGWLTKFGVSHTIVDGCCHEEVLDAIRPETTLVFLESPSSFFFRLQPVEKIATYCREKGIATAIDNTYNSPVNFQPAKLGVDLVCESATKYMGGHSDLTAGSIAGTKERMDRIVRREIMLLGNVLHPQAAFLLLRGLRTLPLRLKRHEETANVVAAWVQGRPEVESVNHVGLDSHPQRELAKTMLNGTGGLFSFQPKVQNKQKVFAFCDALNLFGTGISWGGHESLCVPLHVSPCADEPLRWIVRLYCGLEDAPDLIADLDAAFAHLR